MHAIVMVFVSLILKILELYSYVVIAAAVLSWLVAFNVVNPRNRIVALIGETLYRLTEPVLQRIRRFMPNLGTIDISPVVLLLLIWLIQSLIVAAFAAPIG